jgi:hypothetical protein
MSSMAKEITREWFIGFTEGEGCWTWLGKWNNTTRNNLRVYYRRGQPQFLVGQNGRQVLDEIATWLAAQGIVARVWPKKKNGRGTDGDEATGLGAFELRVVGYANAERLCAIFEGRLRIDFKREQFERWRDRVMDPRTRGAVADDEILGPVPQRERADA